jgi:hypothetical protein
LRWELVAGTGTLADGLEVVPDGPDPTLSSPAMALPERRHRFRRLDVAGATPAPGDRMLLWCDGGPSISRLVHWPPPLEIPEEGGLYVLVDEGPPPSWRYQFVADR